MPSAERKYRPPYSITRDEHLITIGGIDELLEGDIVKSDCFHREFEIIDGYRKEHVCGPQQHVFNGQQQRGYELQCQKCGSSNHYTKEFLEQTLGKHNSEEKAAVEHQHAD